MTAPTIAQALVTGWIARFGVPHNITTDIGRQFESSLFSELVRLLGITHLRTTAYHPQSNGIIERWHRTLKAAILCHDPNRWTEHLPVILLGLRTTHKEDIGASPAEMVHGTTLRIPSEFFIDNALSRTEADFVVKLREAMRDLRPKDTAWHGNRPVFVHQDLQTCKHVFIRNDSVRPSLSPPYDGPFKVLSRNSKHFKVDVKGRTTNVSIDRLKPAYTMDEQQPSQSSSSPAPTASATIPPTRVTRSGRRVVIPLRYR
ncbi:uncharacterized protein LOC129765958 [Toxorhynchites rutilus septentrionalis]|uniref:uncharacterized protein LOC129765958 n=1 Tax=Toxorhynchites rutilus septentrionalis TaxID=329112 RepID=UPI002479FA99|nr:uncharacterized protein LOC129765958 [Toxorhynchites rutilus septentrionalis]